ncbi:hypothetical protein DPEC_G00316800 [Dallia pectoralis]|uniref:Uncharacterized protein n=1 Tax=Dallia pectoralis TaxID=75939 RepID=A0ACC2FD23_DALPE|nr:hypothetical protein DPEC_G00316800 [Dallia pectoralis]
MDTFRLSVALSAGWRCKPEAGVYRGHLNSPLCSFSLLTEQDMFCIQSWVPVVSEKGVWTWRKHTDRDASSSTVTPPAELRPLPAEL